ncbi:hypothetical protein [Paraburkholderia antibiotica]|uniref:Phage protein n=1 Tax=Paraburkholderia antibiotica TaxID=2728839 RepID=A0A7X9ZWF9_9BURK|nr:hypothetical protein [Paraburkholderia antibiotica]NML31149.1 hypothetical protein [Paraburkholderia antibiotica]
MTNTKEEIQRRLSALVGLDISSVSYAADMLTLHFGPQKQYTTRRGTLLEGGAWALHIQCGWRLEQNGQLLASYADFSVSEDSIRFTAHRIHDWLMPSHTTTVQGIDVGDMATVTLILSRGLRLTVTPHGVENEEDWRVFEPDSDAKHFVIEGGKVDPWSLS